MFNVHVRVNDAATGQPTPVRLRISDASGRVYPPLGRVAEFATGRNEDVGGHVMVARERWQTFAGFAGVGGHVVASHEPWYYIDGACEVPLPGGVPLVIEVTKGPEYTPIRQETTLGIGQMALRLTIDGPAERDRWFAGDTRCHFLTPHAALLEAAAEDLAVVHLLAAETMIAAQDGTAYRCAPSLVAFSGQKACLERLGHVVAVNTLNRHPVLGELGLLHCHRPVFPLSFGGAESTDDWSLADWCDQCHRKKGLVVWAGPVWREARIAPEAFADLVLGRIDAVEVTPGNVRAREWYRAWSAGIRFPLVGASCKESNGEVLGAMRTCARLADGEPFSLAAWIESVRSGRTFVTTGVRFRDFRINGQEPGAIIDLDKPGRVTVNVFATSREPASRPVEVIVGGDVVEKLAAPDGIGRCCGERELQIERSTWIAARCVGSPQSHSFAHTSPVFVRVGGKMPADAEVSRQYAEWLGRTVDWVDTVGRFEIPRRKEQLRALLEQARQNLLARADG